MNVTRVRPLQRTEWRQGVVLRNAGQNLAQPCTHGINLGVEKRTSLLAREFMLGKLVLA